MPSRAEQQLMDFYVNGSPSNDVTSPLFGTGAPNNNFQTGCCSSYHGPGQGHPDSTIALPGGFQTTSSGPGAISEASAHGHGTKGGIVVNGHTANDAYDGYGGIGFKQADAFVADFGGLTVTRQVDVTHGPNDTETPITATFANGGVANAARWVETITNTTNAPITGTFVYSNNLGSDSNTKFVASSSGNNSAQTGNLYLVSIQNSPGGNDPVITHVLGNNAYTLNTATMVHADGDDNPEWDYPVTVQPGQTVHVVLFSILTADVNFDPANPATDIALGAQLAGLLTNNGQPIAADSVPFTFFQDLGVDELKSIANFDFVGLTIDTSRAFFDETNYALQQGTPQFDGGTLKPTGPHTFDQSFVVNAGGGTIDNTNGNLTFAGEISGVGGLAFAGSNTTRLTGSDTYTGGTTVNGGTLEVDGTLTSANVVVNAGGTLSGTGKIGDPVIQAGGTLAPGSAANPTGTLTIVGPLSFQAGSFYTINVTPTANSFTNVTGTTVINGGTVNVVAGAGTYTSGTRYTLLTASGGVAGTFTNLTTTTNLAFLSPTLSYDANDVFLTLSQSAAFTAAARTPNQRATAAAIQSLGPNSGLYNAVLNLTAAQAQAAFNAASGEIHASAVTAGFEDSRFSREAIFDRLDDASRPAPALANPLGNFGAPTLPSAAQGYAPVRKGYDLPSSVAAPAPAPYTVWGAGFGDFGRNGGNGNAAALSRSLGGFVLGADARIDAAFLSNWRIGLAGGYTSDDLKVSGRASTGTYETYFGGLYAGAQYGAFDLKLGVLGGGTNTDTRRTVAFTGFLDGTRANYGGDIVQGFGELGYKIGLPRGFIEPLLQGAVIHLDQDGFTETGNVAALRGSGRGYDEETTTLGIRAESPLPYAGLPLIAKAFVGWRHAFGDVNPRTIEAFTGGGSPFSVAGAPIDRDAVYAEAGLDYKATGNLTVGVKYTGQAGARAYDNGVRGTIDYRF